MEKEEGKGLEGYDHLRRNRAAAAIKGVFWAGWTSLMPVLSGFCVFLYSSKILSPGDFGSFSLALAIVTFSSSFSFLGFGESLVQFKQIGRGHLNSVFWLCLSGGTCVYSLLALGSPLIAKLFAADSLESLLLVVGLKVIFDTAAIVPNALLSRTMSFSRIARRTTISSSVSAAVSLVLLYCGLGVWALAASVVTLSFLNWIVAQLSVTWRPSLHFRRADLRDLWDYGIFASGSRLIQSLNIDQLLIGGLLGAHSLGLYSFARRIFQMMNDLISGALSQVSHALLSSVQSEKDKLREGFFLATFASCFISFPIFGGIAILAHDIVLVVFGERWLDGVFPLQMFCAIGFLSCIGVLQASLINSQGKTKWWMNYQIVKQTALAVTIYATYTLGLDVLALSYALATWLLWPITMRICTTLLQVGIRRYTDQILSPALATLVMVTVIAVARHYLQLQPNWGGLILQISIGGVTYLAFAAVFLPRRLKSVLTRLKR